MSGFPASALRDESPVPLSSFERSKRRAARAAALTGSWDFENELWPAIGGAGEGREDQWAYSSVG
jgi:hypothetical protein